MISVSVLNASLANKKVGRDKIRFDKTVRFTTFGDETPIIYFWESLPNTSEKSDLVIGKYCSIANKVSFMLGGTHNLARPSTYINSCNNNNSGTITSNGDIIIKNDVYIGYGATILSGVTIGNGAVIGAHSLVSRSVPDYTIVAGNPAKTIRMRFDTEWVKRLNEIEWWNLPEELLMENGDLFFVEHLTESNLCRIEDLVHNYKMRNEKE